MPFDLQESFVVAAEQALGAVVQSPTLALSLLLVAGAAVAQESGCKRNEFGVFEDINCAVSARDAADRELNATYAQLIARLGPSEATALRKAQRAWLQFVEADAAFVLAREGDGSSGRLIVVNNREKLTRERLLDLKSWLPL